MAIWTQDCQTRKPPPVKLVKLSMAGGISFRCTDSGTKAIFTVKEGFRKLAASSTKAASATILGVLCKGRRMCSFC